MKLTHSSFPASGPNTKKLLPFLQLFFFFDERRAMLSCQLVSSSSGGGGSKQNQRDSGDTTHFDANKNNEAKIVQ